MSGSKALSYQSQPGAPQPESDWTVISGPLTGSKVRMTSAQFSIGRSHDCDLALPNDPKVSRKHARVYWAGNCYHIQSLVSQNPVLINGKPISDSEIHSGTIVQLGESQLRFDELGAAVAAPQRRGHIAAVPPTGVPHGAPPYQFPNSPRGHKSKKAAKTSGSNAKRFIIYGLIGGLLWWLLSSPEVKKNNPFEIRTEKEIEADIQEAKELQKLAEKMRADRLNPSLSERNAQEHYVKGFRDFRKGQFERSISSFQACLALNPDHPLCNRYLKLSQKKFGELIQYYMVLGRKYRDQNQFRECRSSFRNVMVMTKDPSNSLYKEAKSNYTACNSLVEGRF